MEKGLEAIFALTVDQAIEEPKDEHDSGDEKGEAKRDAFMVGL